MEKVDLLKELYFKRITLDEAYDIKDAVVSASHSGVVPGDIFDFLGMSNVEASAKLHSIPLEVLAKWRYEGWPTCCAFCKKPFGDLEQGGWLGIKLGFNKYGITHIRPCYGLQHEKMKRAKRWGRKKGRGKGIQYRKF